MSSESELINHLRWALRFSNNHGRGPYFDSFNQATQTRTYHCCGCSAIAVIRNGEDFSFNHNSDCRWVGAVKAAGLEEELN